MRTNIEQAIRSALLLVTSKFSETDLYISIASLSYIGDPRMIMGENPKKLVNLVIPAISLYRNLYKEPFDKIIKSNNIKLLSNERKEYLMDNSATNRWNMCIGLPLCMRKKLFIQGRAKFLKKSPPSSAVVRTALTGIVAKAATFQSVKGKIDIILLLYLLLLYLLLLLLLLYS
jgi:hypothetical protein